MKILRIINPDNVTDEVANNYTPRLASRGVVFDENKNVAILPVSNHNYYKLPGGGIENGENEIDAFRRECLEEIGFDVEVIKELGIIIEYKKEFSITQTSYCYIGKIKGEKKEIAFTEDEVREGFQEPKWVPLEEAFNLIANSKPNDYQGRFVKERDTLILETAKVYSENLT